MISLIQNEVPKLKLPEMVCDLPLHEKLNEIPLTKNMNRSIAAGLLGPPGSGKTSLLVAFLATKALFNKVWHHIYVFMPRSSRLSMKNSIFDALPENQVFDDLTYLSLEAVYTKAQADAQKKKPEKSLIVFDDVQGAFKSDDNIEKLLLRMFANRRHARLSFFVLCQTYKSLPKPCRQMFTDIFAFNLSRDDFEALFQEHSKFPGKVDRALLDLYIHRIREESKKDSPEPVFLYFNQPNQKVFMNWDEAEIRGDELFEVKSEAKPAKRKEKRKREEEESIPV